VFPAERIGDRPVRCAVDAAGSVRGGVRRREKNYATDFVGPKASVRRSIKISLLHCLTT
jgi:hypothetical protein